MGDSLFRPHSSDLQTWPGPREVLLSVHGSILCWELTFCISEGASHFWEVYFASSLSDIHLRHGLFPSTNTKNWPPWGDYFYLFLMGSFRWILVLLKMEGVFLFLPCWSWSNCFWMLSKKSKGECLLYATLKWKVHINF